MRRKHNPLLALIALVLLTTILVLTCTGCGAETAEARTPGRFTVQDMGNNCHIITDTETGVQYLHFWYGSTGGGLTVLQPGED